MATEVRAAFPTGNAMLNGILWGGWHWTTAGASTTTIAYHLATANEFGSYDTGWTSIEAAAIHNALQAWANVCNLAFVEVASAAGANFIEHSVAGSFFNSPPGTITLGQHDTPDTTPPLDGYFNYQGFGWDYSNSNGGLQVGGFGYLTLVHELGHGLGLAHPHDTGGGSTIWPGVDGSPFTDTGDNNLNQDVFTVMSYVHGVSTKPVSGTAGADNYGYVAGPMAFDTAAIQYLYGVNNSYHTGNDTYVLPDVDASGTYFTCIWDAGGTDQLAYNGSRACTINLTAATLDNSPTGGGVLSFAAGIFGGFTIANGVTIENASGGSGNDTITGNNVANILTGGAGNDTIDGGGGTDSAVFSGLRSAYTLTDLGGGRVRVSGPDGVDTLSNVERLVFNDQTVTWPPGGPSPPPPPLDRSWHVEASSGDFDGDGRSDILWRNDDGQNATWLMDGGPQEKVGFALRSVDAAWHVAGIGDFDIDGRSDILWRSDDGRNALWEMNGGPQEKAGFNLRFVDPTWHAVAVADFDGDGRADILWRNNDGRNAIWQMNGGQEIAGFNLRFVDPTWHVATVADFNGDDRADILWRNNDGRNAIWQMSGGQEIAGFNLRAVDSSFHVAASNSDFDGDQLGDLLWRNDSTGANAIWEMSGGPVEKIGFDLRSVDPAWHVGNDGHFFF